MSINLSFRTEESTRDRLEQIASSLDRNRNWVINRALDQYIDQYNWELKEIDSGIADADAGRVVSAAEFEAEFGSKRRRVQKKKSA